jgi:hypothetical protein
MRLTSCFTSHSSGNAGGGQARRQVSRGDGRLGRRGRWPRIEKWGSCSHVATANPPEPSACRLGQSSLRRRAERPSESRYLLTRLANEPAGVRYAARSFTSHRARFAARLLGGCRWQRCPPGECRHVCCRSTRTQAARRSAARRRLCCPGSSGRSGGPATTGSWVLLPTYTFRVTAGGYASQERTVEVSATASRLADFQMAHP